jgi:hypothetical protein
VAHVTCQSALVVVGFLVEWPFSLLFSSALHTKSRGLRREYLAFFAPRMLSALCPLFDLRWWRPLQRQRTTTTLPKSLM